ncbi:MAG: PLP-dependent aminotransferase family protein [Verrucomicrobiota bacterium]
MQVTKPHIFKAKWRLLDFMRQADVPGLINLAAGVPSPNLLPGKLLSECFAKAYREEGKKLFAYQAPEGDHGLREILAQRMQHRGVDVSKLEMVLTTGCTQAIHTAIDVAVKPGMVVAVECPAYYGMLELLSAKGVKVLPLSTDIATGIDLERSQKLISQYKPRVLIVCSSLSNPSGATIPEDKRENFVAFCRKKKITIIEDDIYANLIEGGVPRPLRAYDNGETVIYVTSFSKTVAPGLRVGMAIPGKYLESFAEIQCRENIHSSVISERTLKHFFLDPRGEKSLQRFVSSCCKRRKILRRALLRYLPEDALVSDPRGGYMLWVKLAKAVNLRLAQQACLKKRVAFAHGEVFFTKTVPGQYMRINAAKAVEQDLEVGCKVLGKAIKQQLTKN